MKFRTQAKRFPWWGVQRASGGTRGFTLIELLVVVAILALLVSILLPSLNKARQLAKKLVCATLHRGYGLASEMYAENNNGIMMDSYKHLDSEVGLPRYWGSPTMPEKVARCPDDASTQSLKRMGAFAQYGGLAVSIGCNENMLSCSARATSKGPMAFWVSRDKLSGQPSRLMVWADWQNNPFQADPPYAVVKPQAGAMGSLCFRHVGTVSNAVFLDGHVGEMRATIPTAANGHDLAPGAVWNITGSVPQLYKCYYPFGVGATQTAGDSGNRGDWPDMAIK